jgi:hypothetical protein
LALAMTAGLLSLAFAGVVRPLPAASQQLASPSPSPAVPTPQAALSAAPSAAPSVGHRHHGGGGYGTPGPLDDAASPTPTPTSPAFATLDGYWEVVKQTPTTYTYSSFLLQQSGDELTGVWNDDGKKLPLSGNYDGRQFRLVAIGGAHDITLAGYVEGASDMVGIMDDGTTGDNPPAFTASHRMSAPVVIFPKRSKKTH